MMDRVSQPAGVLDWERSAQRREGGRLRRHAEESCLVCVVTVRLAAVVVDQVRRVLF